MIWLTATGTTPIPYRTAGPVTARLRIDHIPDKPPAVGWWILTQDARMIRQALRTKDRHVDLATVEWTVVTGEPTTPPPNQQRPG